MELPTDRRLVEPERLQDPTGKDVSRVTRTFHREEEKDPRSEIDPKVSTQTV